MKTFILKYEKKLLFLGRIFALISICMFMGNLFIMDYYCLIIGYAFLLLSFTCTWILPMYADEDI